MVTFTFYRDLKGIIVSLTDSGRLECSYLGTDPALFIPPQAEARELNFADMDRELAQLNKKIKNILANKPGNKTKPQTRVLLFKCFLPYSYYSCPWYISCFSFNAIDHESFSLNCENSTYLFSLMFSYNVKYIYTNMSVVYLTLNCFMLTVSLPTLKQEDDLTIHCFVNQNLDDESVSFPHPTSSTYSGDGAPPCMLTIKE